MNNKALEILEKYYGYKSFRKGQDEIIENILKGKDVLAIMPTGGGKSVCYQVPAMLLEGVTLVVSPLISLMKDQVDAIRGMGIDGVYINSSLSTVEFNSILDGIKQNKYKIIYIAPERLDSNEFINAITQGNISQIAIDEAHCVSQWGHDFRSSYRRIAGFINKLEVRPIVTAFTATATQEVKSDIINQLALQDPIVFLTGFDRENLSININKSGSKRNYLLRYVEDNKDQCGIIYASTRKEVDAVYEILKDRGHLVGKYHAGLSDEIRKKNQEDFIHDRLSIMVATNAFGMGIDKSNIRYVIHYNMPQNIEGYYQEIGRAGRDGEKSECILLFAPGDIHTHKYLIEVGSESEDRKNNQYRKLQQMVDLVYSNGCYRNYILGYFGEVREKPCENCSSCLNEGEVIDKTIDAQKVLACIYRMKRSFGATMVIDVLRGSKNKKVTQFKFHELTTHGIMKDYSNEGLKEFINTLISHGYVDSVEGTYPTLKLNAKSMKVLKSEEKVEFKEFKMERKISDVNGLFDILRELRLEISKESGIPPYMIFGDGTLREMSIKFPISKSELLDISGVGESKYEKFGERFSEVISSYVEENKIKVEKNFVEEEKEALDIAFEVSTDEELLSRLMEVRKEHAKKEKTLPHLIISKNTLKEISGRYPLTLDNLKDIGGVGKKKIDSYGKDLVSEVQGYVMEKNIDTKWVEKKRRKLIIDGETRTNQEISIDMIKSGSSLEAVVNEIEVSLSTILGYVTDYIKESGDVTFDLNLDNLYNENDFEVILKACEKHGYDKISIIKKEVPDSIKYEAIRAVILKEYFKVS